MVRHRSFYFLCVEKFQTPGYTFDINFEIDGKSQNLIYHLYMDICGIVIEKILLYQNSNCFLEDVNAIYPCHQKFVKNLRRYLKNYIMGAWFRRLTT